MSDLHRTPPDEHPDGLLAGLVDGTLTPAEEAEVRSHLDGCERCREELRLAGSAHAALSGLSEIEPPWGLGRAAIEEARGGGGRTEWRRRATAGLAAAAAVALLVGVGVAVLHGGSSRKAAGGAAPAASPRAVASSAAPNAPNEAADNQPTIVQRPDLDYSKAGIARLAEQFASVSSVTAPPQPSVAPIPTIAPSFPSPVGSASGPAIAGASYTRDPVSCLNRARELPGGPPPIEVIEARFEGQPALIGIYLESTRRVAVWVAATDCTLLHYASQRIT